MTTTRPLRLAWPFVSIVSLAACGGTEPSSGTGTGGSGQGVGGAGGSGTGGVGATSGASATGGASGNGGAAGAASGAGSATAGAMAKGGSSGSGQAGSGAGRSNGGTTSGGAGAGGAAGTAGAAGGTAGTGGGELSAGCGTPTTLKSERTSIDVDGTMREYVLKLPDDYDPSKPYKLIFTWHWRGGVADDVVSGQIIGGPYYGLESRANGSAIFVAPEGIDMGWANTGGRDIAFLRAMLDRFNSNLCIDQGRIFSTGFSFGGMMSDAIGCEMADVFRAIAPMSGAFYSGCKEPNMNPIALWLAHGDNDTVVPLANGQEARDKFLARNGCGSTTTPTDPSPCVSYEGCMEGYPVVYCEFSGGHMPASFGPNAIWTFFNQF